VVPPIDERTLELAASYSILLIPYDVQTLSPSFLKAYHPSSLRWILFDDLFYTNSAFFSSSYQKILSLDVRDSAFQSDPFAAFSFHNESPSSSSKLFVFGETQHNTIGMCGWNSGWIKDCFGDAELNKITNNAIICSGIILGNYFAMSKYLETMRNFLIGNYPNERNERNPYSLFPTCERNGVDQGLHNYIIYNKLVQASTIASSSPFMASSAEVEKKLAAEESGRKVKEETEEEGKEVEKIEVSIEFPETFPIINLQANIDTYLPSTNGGGGKEDGSIYMLSTQLTQAGREGALLPFSIVHQYDRNYEYQMILAKQYIDWIPWKASSGSSLLADWKETKACSLCSYKEEVDLLKGQCDVSSVRVMTISGCCEACQQKRQSASSSGTAPCTGFTYVKGICYLKNCPIEHIKASVGELDRTLDNSSGNNLAVRSSAYYQEGTITAYYSATM
jgi:hypothetical protein